MTAPVEIDRGILELESKIGVKSGFFASLLEEDDWSFVIKLHALFEAACTHLLLYHFKGEPQLADIVSRIELSGKPVGKAAILGRLGLVGKEKRRFLSSLSELRNILVHDVRNSEFSLQQYVESMTPEVLRSFAVAFSPTETLIRKFSEDPKLKVGFDMKLLEQSDVDAVVARARCNPKLHIWIAAYNTLTSIVDMYDYSDYKQWINARAILDDNGKG